MKIKNYLVKRPNSQNWQLRYMVPKAVRTALGKSEFTKSLGTSDRSKAESLALPILMHWKALIDDAVSGSSPESTGRVPSRSEMEEAVVAAAYIQHEKKFDAYAAARLSKGIEGEREMINEIRELQDKYKVALARKDYSHFLEPAETLIARHQWVLPSVGSEFDYLCQKVGEAFIGNLKRASLKAEGHDHLVMPPPSLVMAINRVNDKAKPGETILELFDRYISYRLAERLKRADTAKQDRKVVQQFVDFVGRERSVRSIAPEDVRDWRDTLYDLPPSYKKMKEYRGLSIREAAAKAKGQGGKRISPNTLNKYLSTLSPFFTWAKSNRYIDANPCDDLFFENVKGKNPRPPLSVTQLNTIFSSPLFSGFLRDGKEHIPGSQVADDWRFWIPLICMFTGARIGEIAQLRVQDVEQSDGSWIIHIRSDEQTGQSTKSGYSRIAPIHSKLVEQGFLAFHERQSARASRDENSQLFPELEPNERGQIGGTPSRFWRDYLRRIGLKGERDGIGAHSFRHTMADELRRAGYLDDEIEVALGHNQKTVTSGYGVVRQGTARRLIAMFESVTFEGVKLASPQSHF